MSLERIYIGPNIPLLSNLSLVSVSKQGEVVRSGAEALLASASNQPTTTNTMTMICATIGRSSTLMSSTMEVSPCRCRSTPR